MKPALPLLFSLSLVTLLAGCSSSGKKKTARSSSISSSRLTVRTTAYTHTEAGGVNNAIGSRLRFGGDVFSAASDWSWLPLGTRFRMAATGRTYVIEDYGSALVGKKTIDLYQPSMAAVRAWGVRNVEIEVLEWGSKVMSWKMLKPRATRDYIRTMVAELEKSVPASARTTSASASAALKPPAAAPLASTGSAGPRLAVVQPLN